LRPSDAFKDKRVVQLIEAIGKADIRAIEAAVKADADINAVGVHQTTPLHWALTKRDIGSEVIRRVLELGGNPNAKDELGNSPVSLTAGGDRLDLLQLFLSHGGDPNIRKNDVTTALQEAVNQQRSENIRVLLKHGANANARNGETPMGDTVCLDATAIARFDLLVLLLENGLTEDLERCARYVRNTAIASDSPQQAWRDKALELIRTRGVKVAPPTSGMGPRGMPRCSRTLRAARPTL
jgi:ankyrin repeat protein